MTIELLETRLTGPLLLQPAVHGDARGFFCETYRAADLEVHGVHGPFVQDNHSRSARGVIRGLHFAVAPGAAAKLVRCGRGRIWDVVVDVRPGSPTFGEWEGVELDDETMRMFFIPPGFAHGFCVLSEVADVLYKQSAYYDPAVERGFRPDDPDVAVRWPIDLAAATLSARDLDAPTLAEIAPTLAFGDG